MKKIVLTLLVCISIFSLTGCKSDADKIRSDYNKQGATLEKDHLYVSTSVGKLKKILEDDATGTEASPKFTIVFFGNTSCISCVNNINGINQAAKLVNNDSKNNVKITEILYLRSSESVANSMKEQYKVITTITPTIWVFKNGEKFIDGSSKTYRTDSNLPKVNNAEVSYTAWARAIFQRLDTSERES